ncbi:DNA topoisomerase IB [Leucobacter luti]|uniref:DNA topoisomerase IB n=1 Tax=Leucobacter luti TaxID=340320 RepID=UPI003D090AF7
MILREPAGRGFVYRHAANGRRVTRSTELRRIEALAIPPAWTSVEIASSPRAKVLARGFDAAGRQQAIYHPSFTRKREREKFARLLRFGEALPALRKRVDRDLRRRRLSKDRVTAGAVRLIDLGFFRVGNREYTARHGSYGVTTLLREHVEATGSSITLDFTGKHGKRQRRRVADERIARLVARLQELPGDDLFRFIDDGDAEHGLRSRDVNEYVRRNMGEGFTAKDFRTWGGTVQAITLLQRAWSDGELASPREAAATSRRVVREVAELLGNTAAVTRSSYIDPLVLGAAEQPEVWRDLAPVRSRLRPRRHAPVDEQFALAVLKELHRTGGPRRAPRRGRSSRR